MRDFQEIIYSERVESQQAVRPICISHRSSRDEWFCFFTQFFICRAEKLPFTSTHHADATNRHRGASQCLMSIKEHVVVTELIIMKMNWKEKKKLVFNRKGSSPFNFMIMPFIGCCSGSSWREGLGMQPQAERNYESN